MNISIVPSAQHTLNKPAIILRDLWAALELVKPYAGWYSTQLAGFTQGVDYMEVSLKVNINNVALKDIAVTFEAAKHIALMSRTEKGRQYRQKLIELENAQQFNLPTTYLEALKCLVTEVEEHDKTKAALAQKTETLKTVKRMVTETLDAVDRDLKPKAKAFDEVIGQGENMLISEAAKLLGVQQATLFNWLSANHWIFRRSHSKPWQAYADKVSAKLMAHRYTKGTDANGVTHNTCTAMLTPAGLLAVRALAQG